MGGEGGCPGWVGKCQSPLLTTRCCLGGLLAAGGRQQAFVCRPLLISRSDEEIGKEGRLCLCSALPGEVSEFSGYRSQNPVPPHSCPSRSSSDCPQPCAAQCRTFCRYRSCIPSRSKVGADRFCKQPLPTTLLLDYILHLGMSTGPKADASQLS